MNYKTLINTEDFNQDIFLTSEGRNVEDYVKFKYPNHTTIFQLNDLFYQILYPFLDTYFTNLSNYTTQKEFDISNAKEIAYNEMIQQIDQAFKDDIVVVEPHNTSNSTFDLDIHKIIDSTSLN